MMTDRYVGMMNDNQTMTTAGQRGPADHATRDQIIAAAHAHFSHYGYDKTTVSDLAKSIGFSKAYIYKFFESKQAIGQAICEQCLSSIIVDVEQHLVDTGSATEKLRCFAHRLTERSVALFAENRRIYEIAVHSTTEKWPSSQHYIARLTAILSAIIVEGRESGEFERKTPLDETCRAILGAMEPYVSPVMLRYKLDDLPRGSNEMVSLVLRSLAP